MCRYVCFCRTVGVVVVAKVAASHYSFYKDKCRETSKIRGLLTKEIQNILLLYNKYTKCRDLDVLNWTNQVISNCYFGLWVLAILNFHIF